jgi:hypothetical protein
MIGTLDSQVIEKFKEFQKNTGKYLDLTIEDIELELLPLDFGDITDANIPEKYKTLGITNAGDYNRVNGNIMRGRH